MSLALAIIALGTACEKAEPTIRVEDCQKSTVRVLGPGWVRVVGSDETYEVREPSRFFRVTTRSGQACGKVDTLIK